MAISGSDKAYRYALSNVARSGATRSGYVSGLVFISVGGIQLGNKRPVGAPGCIQLESLTITDELNETPNTCTFRVNWMVPAQGSEVIITLGSVNNTTRLFAGHVLSSTQSYFEKPGNLRSDVACVDYTWQFGFPKVTKRYVFQSASVIAYDLITTYAAANGFTGTNVAANLPALDEITYTNEDLGEAMTRLARRIGGYWYVDYRKDVHLFFVDPGQGPADLVPTHRSLAHVTKDMDRSQTLTRVYVEGRGSRLLNAVSVGDTMIPLEAVDMFAVTSDVFAKLSFQGSSGGAQHISFGGVVRGGRGSLVGPGIGPAAAVTLAAVVGAGVTTGLHTYAVTFVTAAGESLPSPVASITTGAVPDPTMAPGPLSQTPTHNFNGSNIPIGHTCLFSYSYSTQESSASLYTGPLTLPSPPSTSIVTISNQDSLNPTMSAPITVPVPYSTDPRVKWILIWARDPATTGAGYVLIANAIPNVTSGGTYVYTTVGSQIAPASPPAPTSNTTATNAIAVSNIAIGSAAVTQRKLYRTVAGGGGALKLLTTLADNTNTTYTDTTPDASLGANAPSVDTSGLQQPDGQVVAGATSLVVAGTSPFETAGGWAIIGNGEQVIRYTGITASSLTGIPPSGIGAIVAAITYNSTVTAAPMLTGIPTSGTRALSQALVSGDEIYLVVQVDDTARQAQLAASLGGTGIREEWVQDRRLSITEARARGNATLGDRMLDQVRVRYTSRDLQTRSGKEITVNLPAPTSIVGTFRIQQVVVDNFRPYPTQYPTFTVQASSSRFSFEDLLRVATRDVAR